MGPNSHLPHPRISTGHCRAAVIEALACLAGINSVEVDLEAKLVRVTAEQIDDDAVIAAVDHAGYEAVRARAADAATGAPSSGALLPT